MENGEGDMGVRVLVSVLWRRGPIALPPVVPFFSYQNGYYGWQGQD